MPAPKDRISADNIVLLGGEPIMPDRLKLPEQRAKWKEKVAVYRQRGLSVKGFEDQLALYVCELVSVEQQQSVGLPVKGHTLAQLRAFGREFYDSPQSTDQGRKAGVKPDTEGNPFAQRGTANKPK